MKITHPGAHIASIGLLLCFVPPAQAVEIDFTGATVILNDGTTQTTDANAIFQDVLRFEDQGFKMEFSFSGPPRAFSSIVGDYYSTGNDVLHLHWDGSGLGETTELRVSRIDGATFDLGGFRVSTNTSVGGGAASGTEMTWINSSKQDEIFFVDPDSWGLGAGPDPLISIASGNTLFDDIE